MEDRLHTIELEKAYNPKDFEDRIYADWEKHGCFKPVKKADSTARYVVAIPPPNVTGVLHMGHGLNNVLQVTFYKRLLFLIKIGMLYLLLTLQTIMLVSVLDIA